MKQFNYVAYYRHGNVKRTYATKTGRARDFRLYALWLQLRRQLCAWRGGLNPFSHYHHDIQNNYCKSVVIDNENVIQFFHFVTISILVHATWRNTRVCTFSMVNYVII